MYDPNIPFTFINQRNFKEKIHDSDKSVIINYYCFTLVCTKTFILKTFLFHQIQCLPGPIENGGRTLGSESSGERLLMSTVRIVIVLCV